MGCHGRASSPVTSPPTPTVTAPDPAGSGAATGVDSGPEDCPSATAATA